MFWLLSYCEWLLLPCPYRCSCRVGVVVVGGGEAGAGAGTAAAAAAAGPFLLVHVGCVSGSRRGDIWCLGAL